MIPNHPVTATALHALGQPFLSEREMLHELSIVFPALWARPLREFGPSAAGRLGVWTGPYPSHRMPDGAPIFLSSDEVWCLAMNEGFERWLLIRGWTWRRFNRDVFWLVPSAHYYGPDDPMPSMRGDIVADG